MLWEAPANMDELYKPLQDNLLAWEAGNVFAFTIIATHSNQRVLEKIGMKFIEYIPQGFQKQGKWIEENKMGITKEEWLLLSHANRN
jgi:RimJ/RimL family protein N-acetyltransferase